MKSSANWKRAAGALGAALVCLIYSAYAQDPCSENKQRALVMSGGGPKGALEAGAVYHLVVERKCDFHEFSGSSVGALNAVFLAQAANSTDAAASQGNLADQAQALVSL